MTTHDGKIPLHQTPPPGNSHNARQSPSNSPSTVDREGRPVRQRPIVSGPVRRRQKTTGSKIVGSIIADEAKGIGMYILKDVLVPAVKNLIYEAGMGSLEMGLFGKLGKPRGQGSPDPRSGRVNYTAHSTGQHQRSISQQGRVRHDFDEVIFTSLGEAEGVLDEMIEYLYRYGEVTVADFYGWCGLNGSHQDTKYGWTDLRAVHTQRLSGGGYILSLPKTQFLG